MPDAELLAALPTLERTVGLTRALAVLDIVMSEEWEDRYFSFDPAWAEGEQMASMRNGQGDTWFCWIGAAGAAIAGFDHEAAMTPYAHDPPRLWPGLVDDVPEAFRVPVLEEPAFSTTDLTFVIWRQAGDAAWQASSVQPPDGPDPDGAQWLLDPLVEDRPERYVGFVEEYYEVEVPLDAVAAVYAGEPLTPALVAALNPERDTAAARAEAAEAGHPT